MRESVKMEKEERESGGPLPNGMAGRLGVFLIYKYILYFLLLISRERKEERKRIKGFMDKRKSEKDKTRERKRGDHSQTASHAVWTKGASLITLLNIPHSQNKPFSH